MQDEHSKNHPGELDPQAEPPDVFNKSTPEDSSIAIKWWLLPIGIFFFLVSFGFDHYFTWVTLSIDDRIASDRFEFVFLLSFVISIGMIYFPPINGRPWNSWSDPIRARKWQFITLAFLFVFTTYWDSSRKTHQVLYFQANKIEHFCQSEVHEPGASRDILKVGGVVDVTYKGRKEVSREVLCNPCWDFYTEPREP